MLSRTHLKVLNGNACKRLMERENNIDILLFGADKNPDSYGILALAYMGDAVMELFARDLVLHKSGEVKPGGLVRASKAYITCEAQSDAAERILPKLSESEAAVFKRGRNAKTHFSPNHGDIIQYRRATGLEALFGYLYVSGDIQRAKQLFLAAFLNENNT